MFSDPKRATFDVELIRSVLAWRCMAIGNVETPEGEVFPYKTDDEDGQER